MILTKEQRDEFENAARPLIKFLAEGFHPYVTVITNSGSAEILESSAMIRITDYIKD
jgi:hypothetical protein